jgi:signal transduction histidine kinase
VLTVRDTGIGIEPQMLPRLFNVFAQADRSLERSRGGLGLGLAVVKGLVELHGGEVSAASEGLGRGAELTVRLPLEAEPKAPSTPADRSV